MFVHADVTPPVLFAIQGATSSGTKVRKIVTKVKVVT